jgi:hypothetical protein
VSEWRTVTTAPTGTLLLFCSITATELKDAFFVDWLADGSLRLHPKFNPTHWMYLPEAPSSVKIDGVPHQGE